MLVAQTVDVAAEEDKKAYLRADGFSEVVNEFAAHLLGVVGHLGGELDVIFVHNLLIFVLKLEPVVIAQQTHLLALQRWIHR